MEKATGRFEKYFKKLLKENMTTGSTGMEGTGDGFAPNNANSSDSYAEGDNRFVFPLFGKGKVLKRIKKRKKKEKKAKKVYLPGENEESTVTKVDDISDYM